MMDVVFNAFMKKNFLCGVENCTSDYQRNCSCMEIILDTGWPLWLFVFVILTFVAQKYDFVVI
jgi:hypothetical protein